MNELPFQISVECSQPEKRSQTLNCKALLRSISGVRDVYDADWNGRAVIVKVFSNTFNAARHIKREWEGLNLLRKLDIAAPQPLFFGKTEDGRAAIAIERIGDSKTALDIFNQSANRDERLRLLIGICKELALQNSRGVLQSDLHLGNFLIAGEKVFALDPARMKFLHRPLNKNESIEQLAMLATSFLPDDFPLAVQISEKYFQSRNWKFEEQHNNLLLRKISKQRLCQARRGLKKAMQTNKTYLRFRCSNYFAVFNKNFLGKTEPQEFITKMDELMNAGQILKKGNTCYVSAVVWNNRTIVIKRYNHKGWFHSLRHTLKRSRARRSWLYGHRMRLLGINTACPFIFVESRKNGLIWKSYIVNEYIDGQNIDDFSKSSETTDQQKKNTLNKTEALLNKLYRFRITHSDLKPSNILISNNAPFLIDLDSIQIHRSGLFIKKGYRKMLASFHNRLTGRKNNPPDKT